MINKLLSADTLSIYKTFLFRRVNLIDIGIILFLRFQRLIPNYIYAFGIKNNYDANTRPLENKQILIVPLKTIVEPSSARFDSSW